MPLAFASFAGLLILFAGLVFYLASRQQRLLTRRLRPGPALISGLLACVLAGACLWQICGPAASIFIVFTALMLWLTLLPLLVAYRYLPRGRDA